MRVVVVQTPPKSAGAAPRPAIGAFEWFEPDPMLTLVLKAAYTVGDGGALEPDGDASELSWEDRPWDHPAAQGDLYYPWDFAPYKPAADIVVVGEALGAPMPHGRLGVDLRVGEWRRSLVVNGGAPSPRIPLAARFVMDGEGRPAPGCGPSALPEELRGYFDMPEDWDYGRFQCAHELQRRPFLEPGEPVVLSGVRMGEDVAFTLPTDVPRVLAEWKASAPPVEIALFADTLWIDTRKPSCAIVWRGLLALPAHGAVDRLYVHVENAKDPSPWDGILRLAARSDLEWTANRDVRTRESQDDEERDRIAEVRWDLAVQDRAPPPELPLPRYAAISAELAEQREPRGEVLERHGFDETSWTVEERAWLESMAEAATDGDGTVAADYGEAFVAAQDALARPEEAERGAREWAEISVGLENAEDPVKELEARGLKLAEWMRLERRIRQRSQLDPEWGAEAERALADARRRADV